MAKKYKGFKGSGMRGKHITKREMNEIVHAAFIHAMGKLRGKRKE